MDIYKLNFLKFGQGQFISDQQQHDSIRFTLTNMYLPLKS